MNIQDWFPLGWTGLISLLGLRRWHNCKESDRRDMSSIPGSGRFPGVGNGNLLQYSWLEISMDRVNLVVYSPWGHKKLDTTEWLSMHASVHTVDLGICSLHFYFRPLWDLWLSLLDNILLGFAFLIRPPWSGSAFYLEWMLFLQWMWWSLWLGLNYHLAVCFLFISTHFYFSIFLIYFCLINVFYDSF